MFSALLATAFAVTVVVAQTPITDFTTSPVEFIFPAPRGFTANTASVYPCGGQAVSASRTRYPMSGGVISLQSQTLAKNINLLHVNKTNPVAFHDFSTYTQTVLSMSVGDYCVLAPDFNTLRYTAGQNVTLLMIYQLSGNKTYNYHCADLTLVENSAYTAPTQSVCTNSSIILELAPANDSLVLSGTNSSAGAAGGDGQAIQVSSTPTARATTVVVPSTVTAPITRASSSVRSTLASSVASGAATTSPASAGLRTVDHGGVLSMLFAGVGLAGAYFAL